MRRAASEHAFGVYPPRGPIRRRISSDAKTRSMAVGSRNTMEWQPEDEDLSEDWGESIDDAGPEFYEGLVGDVQEQAEQQQRVS